MSHIYGGINLKGGGSFGNESFWEEETMKVFNRSCEECHEEKGLQNVSKPTLPIRKTPLANARDKWEKEFDRKYVHSDDSVIWKGGSLLVMRELNG